MPQLTLYIDTSTGNLISSLNRSAVADVSKLPLYYPDVLQLQIYLLTPIQQPQPGQFPFSIINTEGLALLLEISDGKADADRNVYASQYVWSTDANNQYFYATLNLNTAQVRDKVQATEPNNASAYLKIAYVGDAGQTDVFSQPIPLRIGVGTPQLVVPPELTALAQEVADQRYVPLAGKAGLGFMLVTPNGKKIYLQAVDNDDGTASFDASPVN